MFCLRSWLPLLFIPTNASPLFLISFVTLTYILHRPCIYCSALLVILFASTCNWSDRCFFNLRSDWLAPRYASDIFETATAAQQQHPHDASMVSLQSESLAGYILDAVNSTAKALAGAAMEETQRRLSPSYNNSCPSSASPASSVAATVIDQISPDEWAGFGLEWLRSLVGRREWTLPCVDVKIRL